MGYVTKKAAQRFEEKKAAIYVRVSTQYQVDRLACPSREKNSSTMQNMPSASRTM